MLNVFKLNKFQKWVNVEWQVVRRTKQHQESLWTVRSGQSQLQFWKKWHFVCMPLNHSESQVSHNSPHNTFDCQLKLFIATKLQGHTGDFVCKSDGSKLVLLSSENQWLLVVGRLWSWALSIFMLHLCCYANSSLLPLTVTIVFFSFVLVSPANS